MATEAEKRLHRCCFTGHRPEKLHISESSVKRRLKKAIRQAIEDGFTTFLSGMARGVDMWAAELVLKEREKDDRIRLICASPFVGFENSWNLADRRNYENIMKQADYMVYVCSDYTRSCFQIRNRYMVDRSARVIAAYNGESGGTKNTILYAEDMGVEVFNILDETDA